MTESRAARSDKLVANLSDLRAKEFSKLIRNGLVRSSAQQLPENFQSHRVISW